MCVCQLCRRDSRWLTMKFWTWRRASWSVHKSLPGICCESGRWWRRWKRENVFWQLYPGAGQKKAKTGTGCLRLTIVSQEALSTTTSADWEGMKIEEKNEGQNTKNPRFSTFHWCCCHGNHFHNTVAVKSAYGAACTFLTRLQPHKGKPRGDTERTRRKGKKGSCRGR